MSIPETEEDCYTRLAFSLNKKVWLEFAYRPV